MVLRDGFYMPVFWYPAHYGKLFLKLFRLYLEHERPRSELPWLFLTENGLPMTAKAYAEQHRAAIIRYGMTPQKASGTTPHGHRHAYGQRLQNAADRHLITNKTIQVCMHHRSILSQGVYTGRTSAAINEILEHAALALSGPSASPSLVEAFS
jgi:integrase